MPRASRTQYPGAIHLVMNRGDCREAIFRDGLDQLGWARAELERRTKGDRAKIRIARRRRTETVFTLKWIAAQLPMATWTQVAHRLQQMKDKSQLRVTMNSTPGKYSVTPLPEPRGHVHPCM